MFFTGNYRSTFLPIKLNSSQNMLQFMPFPSPFSNTFCMYRKASSMPNQRKSACSDSMEDDDPKRRRQENDQYIQIGKAIDTLRQELPAFFDNNGLVDYSIYRNDIILQERHHHKFYVSGLTGYRWFMKCAGRVFKWYYTDLRLQLRSVNHQRLGADELHIRWTVEGTPKPALLFSYLWPFSSLSSGGSESSVVEKTAFEGVFIYKFDKKGLIYEHQITDIQPAPRRFIPLHAFGWFQFQRGRLFGMPELNSRPIDG